MVLDKKIIKIDDMFLIEHKFILYCQAIADLSEKLEPLIEGVRQNKTHWLEESQQTYHPQSHN